jgi:hypothetical protein
MSSINPRLIAKSLIVQKIAVEVIRNIKIRNLEHYKDLNRIHSELVPRVVDGKKPSILVKEKPKPESKVANSLIKNFNFIPVPIKPLPIKPIVVKPKQQPVKLVKPEPVIEKKVEIKPEPVIERKVEIKPVVKPKPVLVKTEPIVVKPKPKALPIVKKIKKVDVKPVIKTPIKPGYGKLLPLLTDSQVMVIECSGADKPLQVIAGGRKHITNLSLNEDEINAILKKVSEDVHIPLLEGVFKAVHDNFLINAVVSRMVGSKFIIKKQSMMLGPSFS